MSESMLSSELGEPLVSARSSEIYAWPSQCVLKLFRPGIAAQAARWERINAEEAHALGATEIRCHGEVEIGGRYGIVMSRLDGRTLTRSADGHPLNLLRMPRVLATLHARMHALRSERLRDIRALIAASLDDAPMAFLTAAARNRARDHLLRLPDGHALLHMDYHTDNVLVDGERATVIDWATAARGDPGADLAMTYFLFHEAELFPGITRIQAFTYNALRKLIHRGYACHYRALRQLSVEEFRAAIRRWYLAALIFRLAAWEAPTEVEPLRAKIDEGIARLGRRESGR